MGKIVHMKTMLRIRPLAKPLAIFALTILFSVSSSTAGEVDFSRDVLPILSDKCFLCHGPDAEDGQLRLDSQSAATSDLGGYRAIDSAAPEKSAFLLRIHSADDPMPPVDAEKQLTPRERDLLSEWVSAGGDYDRHWAHQLPKMNDDHDGHSSEQIDQMISKQLESRGIVFSPSADKTTLARRVALTLTGLPPDPKLLEHYMADDSDLAYQRLVETLLASPSFGEHQARYWLDAVRYGDTHGLHLDNRRGIYPYRDWVVNAFNNNLPLNEFITWQLAGDMLPDPTLAQLVATGFVRMNPSTGEGGAISQEFQAKNNFDRVETFGTVFLGMSLTCARCHNHKYDPVTQQEYYQLMAFFNNTTEPALDGNSYTYGPTVRAPDNQDDWQRWNELEARREGVLLGAAVAMKKDDRESVAIDYATKYSQWKATDWHITKPVSASLSRPTDEPKSKQWSVEKGLPGSLSGRAARKKIPGVGQAVWIRFAINVPQAQKLRVAVSGGPGSQVFVGDSDAPALEKTNSDRVTMGKLLVTPETKFVYAKIVGAAGLSEIQFRIENPWDALKKSKNWETTSKRDRLLMLSDPDGPLSDLRQSQMAGQVAEDIRKLEVNFTTSLVAKELPSPRETRMLRRGEYHLPIGDAVKPDVFDVLNAMPKDAPRNRLGLAKWVTSPQNPLVARVLVNRLWQRVFGVGLVRTPEEFGLQGQQPTHPELLDWLAVELHQSGWDLKHLLRLMVNSQTFRQKSAWRDGIDDPENRLFARGPSYRLDAEVLRDIGLWASELLDPTMGGEGVKPYQPSGMWLAMAHPASNTKSYERDKGKRLYRRSLYVYWKRTSPHPMMTLFDAPDRESSCVRRSRTSTPLQSLALLNETQRVEMGRKLAERIIRSADNDKARLEGLFELLVCRKPTDPERKACLELLASRRKRYESNPADAEALLIVGESKRDESQSAIDQAAWTQVAMAVLASDLVILTY